MPLVTCPHCAASVFAIAAGESIGIMGAANLTLCQVLAKERPDQTSIDLLLDCDAMRKAMAATFGTEAEAGEKRAWPGDSVGQRLYERWEQLEGSLLVDEERCSSVVLDISPGGAAIWTDVVPAVSSGTEVRFELAGLHPLPAQLVRLNGRVLGLMFLLGPDQREALTGWLLRRREALQSVF